MSKDTRIVSINYKKFTVPKQWSENAAIIFCKKYCRSYLGRFEETSVEQVFLRLIGFWTRTKPVQDELFNDLWNQYASPNSPQYFNAGIYQTHEVKGGNIGLWYFTKTETRLSGATYIYPQLHACFIQPIEDSLTGISTLLTNEARLFSRGSGTGTNFSSLRAKGERLKGGGQSSGLISFLRVFDSLAGAIKSGGTTRRAAKMVVVDMDHPDIEEFIDWKRTEELKAKALGEAGFGKTWQSESYRTVSGQNSNNSVSAPDAFMERVKSNEDWRLIGRRDRTVNRTVKARELWFKVCEAAWHCADPGVQFTDTINSWNTTPECGRIRASNPCSEHLRLDNSTCNLASINLCKFINGDNLFDIEKFIDVAKRWTSVLNRSIDLAGYPSRPLAYNAREYRDIGLGYCGLGALLMRLCVPYDSDEGRSIAGAIASLMTATAYRQSALLAKNFNSYPAYDSSSHLAIVERHYNAILDSKCVGDLAQSIREKAIYNWAEVIDIAKQYGIRNAQLTVIAPTGTIGITMDCETTGIEPVYDKMTTKTLAGGGTLVTASESFAIAQRKLNIPVGTLSKEEVEKAMYHPVFATAVDDTHGNYLSPYAHVNMVAAVQPHISGGISKTVNLPNSATIDDIDRIYTHAHRSGVKCISVYRDGSKSQPLESGDDCQRCGTDEGCEIG